MFPTLASLIEERLVDDPALTQIAIRAFNEWLHDEWSYDYEGRIFTTPIVNPCIVDEGIAELERVLERGARAVLMRPAPVSGLRGTRSPFLPEFDPFWARVQETGVLVALHASDSGYQDYLNTWEGSERASTWRSDPRRSRPWPTAGARSRTRSPRRCATACSTRFPGVRLMSVENGGSWVGLLLRNLELAYKKMPQRVPRAPARRVPPQRVGQPVLGGLRHRAGRPDRRRAGVLRLRLPPPRGPRRPAGLAATQLDAVPAADVEQIMSTNMFGLLGVAPPVRPAA